MLELVEDNDGYYEFGRKRDKLPSINKPKYTPSEEFALGIVK